MAMIVSYNNDGCRIEDAAHAEFNDRINFVHDNCNKLDVRLTGVEGDIDALFDALCQRIDSSCYSCDNIYSDVEYLKNKIMCFEVVYSDIINAYNRVKEQRREISEKHNEPINEISFSDFIDLLVGESLKV